MIYFIANPVKQIYHSTELIYHVSIKICVYNQILILIMIIIINVILIFIICVNIKLV